MKCLYTLSTQLIIQERRTDASSSTWTVSYYGHDGLGSTRALYSSTGSATDTYNYTAYGKMMLQLYPISGIPTVNNYLFAGEQWDPDLKFYYNRARYLNVDSGRFTSRDTFDGGAGDTANLHRYLYVGDNPINHFDPSGHDDLVSLLTTMANRAYLWATGGTKVAAAFRYGVAALNAIAFFQDPGAYASMGPAAAPEILAGDIGMLYNGRAGLFRASRSAWTTRYAFKTMAAFRYDLNLPAIEVDTGVKKTTSAMLEFGGGFWIGRRFLGRSSNRTPIVPPLNPNPITASHAEGDVFNQAANTGTSADQATLYVDRDLCGACGTRGGVKSMARSLGIKELTVITPRGTQVITINASVNSVDHVSMPLGLLYEFLGSETFQ